MARTTTRKRLVGVLVLGAGFALAAFLPSIVGTGAKYEDPQLWNVAVVSSYVAPMIVGLGAVATVTGSFRSLTALRAATIPVVAWATNTYLDRVAPNPWFTDTVGQSSLRDPTLLDSVVFGLTTTRFVPVAAYCFVFVGVVLARYGTKRAAAITAVPFGIALVPPLLLGESVDVHPRATIALLFGLLPFAVGYLAAADRDETPGWPGLRSLTAFLRGAGGVQSE